MTLTLPRRLALFPLAAAATLLCPLVLLHGRGVAEGAIVAVAVLFLLRSAWGRAWGWLRTPWVRVAAAWWLWLLLCSVPVAGLGQGGWRSLVQAAATVRFLLFVAALEHWVLRPDWLRRWLARLVSLSALYLAAQSLLQALTGRDLFGWPRWGDGSLTGPYREPRVGPPFSRLLFPAVLPRAALWLARGRRLAAAGLALGGVATVVLIGQRMPLLLTLLGLAVSGLLLPRLRPAVAAALLLAVLLVPATAVLSPPTFHHLVVRFSEQMRHFPESPYGRIAARAVALARLDPLTGRGFDGYRTGCADPAAFHGWFGGDGGAADPEVCVQHPHNHYLQALTDAGLPGLLLFCALVLCWLRALGRGLWRGGAGARRAADGGGPTRAVRADGAGVPVVAVSAGGAPGSASRGGAVSASGEAAASADAPAATPIPGRRRRLPRRRPRPEGAGSRPAAPRLSILGVSVRGGAGRGAAVQGLGASGFGASGSDVPGSGASGSGPLGSGASAPLLLPGAGPDPRAEARHALRVGLFVAVLVQEWPIASASSFTSMPLSGWFFLLLGLGLAEARAYMGGDGGAATRPLAAAPGAASGAAARPTARRTA